MERSYYCKGPMPAPPAVQNPDDQKKKAGGDGPRIRCPQCAWQPRRSDLWACVCGCMWHTFDTGGRCPDCHFTWSETQCPKCAGWSAHAAWYNENGGPAN